MEFTLENQMTEPARQWLASQGLTVRAESPVPWGLCDRIGCEPNKIHVARRLHQRQFQIVGSHMRVLLLSMIPDDAAARGITLRQIRKRIGDAAADDAIERDLRELVRRRFVEITPSGAYKSRNGWKPLHRRLVAVELKIGRVPDALAQAQRNLGFADESYVGLPMSLAERMAANTRRLRFTDIGVGLLGVSAERCRVLIRPEPNEAILDRLLQTRVVERFWCAFKRDMST